jgi:hypothetical protein
VWVHGMLTSHTPHPRMKTSTLTGMNDTPRTVQVSERDSAALLKLLDYLSAHARTAYMLADCCFTWHGKHCVACGASRTPTCANDCLWCMPQ